MRCVMGVDGGGSQTTVAIVDDMGNCLALTQGEGANHQIIGAEEAFAHIDATVQRALQDAGLPPEAIAFVQYGLAGADRENDFEILRPGLMASPFPRWCLVSDAWQALRAGAEDNIGVALVCGSGANAVGRNRRGDTVQVGGFGYLFGDAAGGSYLAVEAFRAAVRAFEGREEPTVLTETVPRSLGYNGMQALYDAYLDDPPDEIPLSLTLTLHDAAHRNDHVAQAVLQAMGHEMGRTANAVIRRLGSLAEEFRIPIVLSGSVVQRGRSPFVLDPLVETIRSEFPTADLNVLRVLPVYGSVLLACDHEHLRVPDKLATHFIQEG